MKSLLLATAICLSGCEAETPPQPAAVPAPGQHLIGESDGVIQVADPADGRLFLLSDGSRAPSGVYTSEDGTIEKQYREGRQNGWERHYAAGFVRVTPYVDGKKHGTEIIVDRDTAGDVSHWKTLEFANGEPVGKTKFHFPEVDGDPPNVTAPLEELVAVTNN